MFLGTALFVNYWWGIIKSNEFAYYSSRKLLLNYIFKTSKLCKMLSLIYLGITFSVCVLLLSSVVLMLRALPFCQTMVMFNDSLYFSTVFIFCKATAPLRAILGTFKQQKLFKTMFKTNYKWVYIWTNILKC